MISLYSSIIISINLLYFASQTFSHTMRVMVMKNFQMQMISHMVPGDWKYL